MVRKEWKRRRRGPFSPSRTPPPWIPAKAALKAGGDWSEGGGAEPGTKICCQPLPLHSVGVVSLNAATPTHFGLLHLERMKKGRISPRKLSHQPLSPGSPSPGHAASPLRLAHLGQAGRQATCITLCFLHLAAACTVEEVSSEKAEAVFMLCQLALEGEEGEVEMEVVALVPPRQQNGPREERRTAPAHWPPSRSPGPSTSYRLPSQRPCLYFSAVLALVRIREERR